MHRAGLFISISSGQTFLKHILLFRRGAWQAWEQRWGIAVLPFGIFLHHKMKCIRA